MAGLQVLKRTYRHLNRYREVLTILVKHGFGDLLHSLGLDHRLEAGLKGLMRHPPVSTSSRPERVLLTVQELGPTFSSRRASISPPARTFSLRSI